MIDEQTFKDVLCQFATGVTVVSFTDTGHQPNGLTVNAFCSVSLSPASILVCISNNAECHKVLLNSAYFGVNLLRKDQKQHVYAFAATGEAKQQAITDLGELWQTGTNGIPLIDSLAQIECRQVQLIPTGDHTIMIGEVIAGRVCHADAGAMVYLHRGFVGQSGDGR